MAYLEFTFYIFDLLRNVLTNYPLTFSVNSPTLLLCTLEQIRTVGKHVSWDTANAGAKAVDSLTGRG